MIPLPLPMIWGTYMKLVTKYQISAINSCCEKCAYMFNVPLISSNVFLQSSLHYFNWKLLKHINVTLLIVHIGKYMYDSRRLVIKFSVTCAGRWFSPGTPVSSTNKTDGHDATEILLKVTLNTITLTLCQCQLPSFLCWNWSTGRNHRPAQVTENLIT
jgi:hypothetical protein